MLLLIRRRLDPDEALTLVYAFVCVWRGVAAWSDLVGKPRDAPHLHIPPHWRALLWFGCAAVGVVALRFRRGSGFRSWALSPMGIGGMFTFVLGSYLSSWLVSWRPVDILVDDSVLQGDPHAWGSIPYYMLGVLVSVCLILCPWDWTYLDRPSPRPGRLEKKRSRDAPN